MTIFKPPLRLESVWHLTPFNPEQKWNERPIWQKAVLIVHLAIVAALLGFGIGLDDK